MMVRGLVFCFLIHFNFLIFSQEESTKIKENLIEEVIRLKTDDYFSLDSLFYANRRNKFTEEDYYKLYERSLKKKYITGQLFAANSLGSFFRKKSDNKKSIKYHKEALKLSKVIKNLDVELLSLNMIGVAYRRQGDVRNALNYHQTALTMARRIKKPSISNKKSISISENSIGNIYLALRQYDLALQQFEKSIQIQKELQDKRGLAINYQNIGFAQENLLLLDEALENYKKALKFDEEIDSKVGKIICENSIASVHIKKRNYEKALDIMESVLPEAIDYSNKYYLARTYNNLGCAQLKVEKYKEAEETLKEGLKISSGFENKKNEIRSLYLLSELYENTEDLQKSHNFYKQASQLEKKTLDEKNISYVSNLISKHNMQSKRNEIDYLESQSKIESLLFLKNRNILIITLITIALLSIALYSIYRQKLINNDKTVLLLEQQALQTQMNPHFLFNALNSIKLYIINNDQKQAVYYLNKFSKLIRNILDVSKVKEVSLKEEIATMGLYMSIENIRFSNEIKYSVDVDPDLNTDTIKVPPLILQPFIENAIWHGLSSKEENKEIILSASKVSENIVEVTIADNGIGRSAAAKIKEGKSLKRKSVGIELTKERLKTFSDDYEEEFELVYHDLKNEDNTPAGTKVSIKIPLS